MNGGVNVLNTIYELVRQPNGYPVVIVQNSGRIADVVAYGLRNYVCIAAERWAESCSLDQILSDLSKVLRDIETF